MVMIRVTNTIAIDEGDYPSLPDHLIERIVHTVPGALIDDS